MVLVGIDFSLNSPAFCILKDGKYIWGSVTRSDRSSASLLKNEKKPYFVLDANPDFVLDYIERSKLPEDYSKRERMKIDYFLEIVDTLWTRISNEIGTEHCYVAMEGLSFSSNGNALIDISMATALLRERIRNRIGTENFHVFSPTSIKKFALKGNSKKDELYEALCSRDLEGTNLDDFCRILSDNKSEWITGAKQVNKPIDDLVDATWILLYLRKEILEKNEENFRKDKKAIAS